MKYYIENGHNRTVVDTSKRIVAVRKFLKSILTKSDGKEIGEFAPFTIVSTYGFMKDIVKCGNLDKMDEGTIYSTAQLFYSMGRKDIAKFIDKQGNKTPKEVKSLLREVKQ